MKKNVLQQYKCVTEKLSETLLTSVKVGFGMWILTCTSQK